MGNRQTLCNIIQNLRPIFWLLFFALAGLTSVRAAEQTPQCDVLSATGNSEYPPFLWANKDGLTLQGAVVNLLNKLSDRIGIKIEMKHVGPWSRALQELRTGRIDLMAGAFYTSNRADYMSYFSPPMMYTKSVVWQSASATFAYHSWSDLKERWGVTVINNSLGQTFDNYAKQHLNILSVASVEQAFSMLNSGRADYVLYERSPGLAYIKHLGLEGRIVPAEPSISSEGLFLTLSKKSPCNTELIKQKINDALKILVDEGVPKTVLLESFANWSRQ